MEYDLETIPCNLCNSDNTQKISEKGKFGLLTNVVLCKECGLGYLNPRLTRESMMKFYRDDYDKYYRPNISSDQTGKVKGQQILDRLKRISLLPEGITKLLDIGSGNGDILKAFQAKYNDASLFSLEPSMEAQGILKEKGITNIGFDVEEPWEEKVSEPYDFIIMRHVLEHFMDPVQSMKKINKVLSPAGLLYIAVPNNLKPAGSLTNSWFRNVHTYYFNKFSLDNLMRKTGFEVIEIVEGDSFNANEVFLFARKSPNPPQPSFSKEHYSVQLKTFQEGLKVENSFILKSLRSLKRISSKISKSLSK